MFTSAISREGTLADSEAWGSDSPWTDFMYREKFLCVYSSLLGVSMKKNLMTNLWYLGQYPAIQPI